MAKPQTKKSTGLADIELHPDAWKRFEKFVKTKVPNQPVAKAKPTPSRAKTATRKLRQKA